MSGKDEREPAERRAPDQKNEGEEEQAPLEKSAFKPSRWPGLIWAVPVAAVGIVGWLGISALLHNGPEVTIDFPIAGGLQPSSSKAEYKGFEVGEVESVDIAKSLGHMVVKVRFISNMRNHLGPGTKYWIAGTSFSFSDLASAKALITGPYIGVAPRPGKTVDHAQGLAAPPVVENEADGETLKLVSDRMHNLSPGSPILYQGFKIGEVRAVNMPAGGHDFAIDAFISREREYLIDSNTHFWDAGGVRVTSGGSGPGVELQSIPALFLGAVGFETPPGAARPVRDGAQFKLYASEAEARAAPSGAAVTYRVVFPGGPHGLAVGAPVQLETAPAGAVTSVGIEYDPAAGAVQTEVKIALDPARITLAGQIWNLDHPEAQMNAMLDTLIRKGLRAQLASSVPVIGGKMVSLTLMQGQPEAWLEPGSPPEIPAAPAGGDVGDIIAQVNDILAKIDAMPLNQIADDVHQSTSRLAALARSPETRRTLSRLDQTVAHVEDMTRRTDAQWPDILANVKQSTVEAQDALRQAQGLLANQGAANARGQSSLPQAISELTRAARSLRELTDYLDSHPSAILFGRKD